jgi:hypothetical protein
MVWLVVQVIQGLVERLETILIQSLFIHVGQPLATSTLASEVVPRRRDGGNVVAVINGTIRVSTLDDAGIARTLDHAGAVPSIDRTLESLARVEGLGEG